MHYEIKGLEGDYVVKSHSNILQYKIDKNGAKTGECVIHIITDSIENSEDRIKITKKIEDNILI